MTKIIGQERDCYWHEKFIKNSLSLSPADKIKSLMRATAEVINQTSKKYLKRNLLKTAFEDSFDNKLFIYEQFDDTSFMLKFCRFGSGRYDWSEDLAFLLRDRVLLDLISSEGFCILYVHWGDRKDKNNPLPFSRDTIEVFCNLANKYYNGYIWVSTTKKILNYAYISQNLNWAVTKHAENWIIHISENLNSKLKQPKITDKHLEGITFYITESQTIKIYFKGNQLETKNNPKDHTGKYSISVPLIRLSYPNI